MPTVHTTNTQPRSGFGLLEVPDPPSLPEGSIVDRFIFESPTAAIAIIALGVLAVWLRFRHTDHSSRGTIALGVGVSSCVLVGTVAAFVKTNAEQLKETTVELVAHAIQGQTAKVSDILHDECVLTEPFSRDEMDRDRILRGVQEKLPTVGIVEHAILGIRAHAPNDRFGTVQVKIRVNIQGAGVHFSWWAIEYERDASATWRASGIKPLSMSGRDAL